MNIKKRVRISFRYVRRGQTTLWACVGRDVEENLPNDLWRETPAYVEEHNGSSEWIYVQVEKSIQPEDDKEGWLEEAEDVARVQADQEFRRRHPGATLI